MNIDGGGQITAEALDGMIDAALAAHESWKQRLRSAIETGTCEISVETASLDDQCAFGRWLVDGVPWRARKSWDYTNVKRLHAAFHEEAGRVLHLAVNGMPHDAVGAMTNSTPFAAASERLGYALSDWRQRIHGQVEGLRP